jgi:hypothetical protein
MTGAAVDVRLDLEFPSVKLGTREQAVRGNAAVGLW